MQENSTAARLELFKQHYSTVIYKGYLKVLLEKYERENINTLLIKKVGLSLDYLEDNNNWISEEASESFYKFIDDLEPGNNELDFAAGRNSLSRDDISFFSYFVSTFISIESLISSCMKTQKRINKVDSLEVIESNKDILRLRIKSSRETKYIERIAQNWKGFLTEFPKIFGLPEGSVLINIIDHSTFEITAYWKKLSSGNRIKNKKIGLVTIAFFFAVKICFIKGAFIWGAPLAMMTAILIAKERKLKKLKDSEHKVFDSILALSEQKYRDLLESKKEIEHLYVKSRVLSSVATKVVEAHSADEVIELAVHQLENEMGFGKALFFAADDETQTLEMLVCRGMDREKTTKMLRFSFDLNDDTGHPDHIVNIFKNKNSRRVKVTTEYLQTLSQKTRAFIEGAKISEFFALTVATSEKSLGVLFVTSSKQSQVYTEGDFDTLKTVASHLAMSIEKSNRLEEETRLRKLFESYVSSEVISKSGMGKGKNFFRTGNALIVFCDLRGFTKMMNESTRPDETFQVVQKFYELVTDEVYGAGGFVNKFLGDGALAVFECSKGQENEVTQRAIAAARGIQERSESILGKSIKISAGIHYGEVIFATVGKDPKLEYTVLGNAVNVASRLCTISKDHNNLLIISSPAVAQLNKDHGLSPMGQFSIKGIREDMELFGQEVYLEEDYT